MISLRAIQSVWLYDCFHASNFDGRLFFSWFNTFELRNESLEADLTIPLKKKLNTIQLAFVSYSD